MEFLLIDDLSECSPNNSRYIDNLSDISSENNFSDRQLSILNQEIKELKAENENIIALNLKNKELFKENLKLYHIIKELKIENIKIKTKNKPNFFKRLFNKFKNYTHLN